MHTAQGLGHCDLGLMRVQRYRDTHRSFVFIHIRRFHGNGVFSIIKDEGMSKILTLQLGILPIDTHISNGTLVSHCSRYQHLRVVPVSPILGRVNSNFRGLGIRYITHSNALAGCIPRFILCRYGQRVLSLNQINIVNGKCITIDNGLVLVV